MANFFHLQRKQAYPWSDFCQSVILTIRKRFPQTLQQARTEKAICIASFRDTNSFFVTCRNIKTFQNWTSLWWVVSILAAWMLSIHKKSNYLTIINVRILKIYTSLTISTTWHYNNSSGNNFHTIPQNIIQYLCFSKYPLYL